MVCNFRNFLWVVVPLLSCFFSVFIMIGFLGLVGWKVTVISSNFASLDANFNYGYEYSYERKIFAI